MSEQERGESEDEAEKVAAELSRVVEAHGMRIQDLVVRAEDGPITVDWGEVRPVKSTAYDEAREFLSPKAVAKNIADLAHQPRLQERCKEASEMMSFMITLAQALDALPTKLRAHYRSELMTIVRDVQRDLGLPDLNADQCAQLAMAVLLPPGDDDDDDGRGDAPVPTPTGHDREPVPA